jgi:hypothetical protein
MNEKRNFLEFELLDEVKSPAPGDWVVYAGLGLQAISTGAMLVWAVAAMT